MDGTGGVIVLGVGEVLFRVVTSRELATCDRVHVGPFRALATLIGALAKLFCALAKQPSSGAEETQEKAQDTHFKGQCIVRSVVSI